MVTRREVPELNLQATCSQPRRLNLSCATDKIEASIRAGSTAALDAFQAKVTKAIERGDDVLPREGNRSSMGR